MSGDVSTDDNPYAKSCLAYTAQGWIPLPLPPGRKSNPPKGYTGIDGKVPSREQHYAWQQGQPFDGQQVGNVCLRMADGVIGIDVDDYGGKNGAATLDEAQRRWGRLPDTFRSSARDYPSGIRFYRVPFELAFQGVIEFTDLDGPKLSGIEIIQHRHRYAVVWPSTNPDADGAPYLWSAPSGEVLDGPPCVDDLPSLPDKWVNELHVKRDYSGVTADYEKFQDSLRDADGDMCRETKELARSFIGELASGGSTRHDTSLRGIMWLLRAGERQHRGVNTALELCKQAFITAVSNRASPDEAEAEWDRELYGNNGLGQIQANPTLNIEDKWCVCGKEPERKEPNQPATANDALMGTEPETEASQEEEERGLLHSLWDWHESHEYRTFRDELTKRELARRDAQRTARMAEAAWSRPAPPDILTGTDFMATDYGEDRFLLSEVWPEGAFVLFSAQSKAGKTVVRNNVLRSLLDGDTLFEQYTPGELTGNVLCVDVELTEAQSQAWLAKQQIHDFSQLRMAHFRGRERWLDFRAEDVQEYWKRYVEDNHITCVIVDCVSPIMHSLGIDTNENADVDAWLQGFRSTFETAGVCDGLFGIHHMGHNASRARGASAFEATPDVMWHFMIEKTEKGEPNRNKARFFGAFGRAVSIEPVLAVYDPATDHYSIADEAPTKEEYEAMQADEAKAAKQQEKDGRFHEWETEVARVLAANPDLSSNKILGEVGIKGVGTRNRALEEIKRLRRDLHSQAVTGFDE